jgi:hypothetical protein
MDRRVNTSIDPVGGDMFIPRRWPIEPLEMSKPTDHQSGPGSNMKTLFTNCSQLNNFGAIVSAL